jgi:hypothetical protein
MRRSQLRAGSRWIHKKTQRAAIVTSIVYPHAVEYKYERPTRWHVYMTTIPYTRRTRVRYRTFLLNFEKERAR